jgi:hypothetical protein
LTDVTLTGKYCDDRTRRLRGVSVMKTGGFAADLLNKSGDVDKFSSEIFTSKWEKWKLFKAWLVGRTFEIFQMSAFAKKKRKPS